MGSFENVDTYHNERNPSTFMSNRKTIDWLRIQTN